MAKKEVTIYDIAEQLDVTASTVSRALRDHPHTSQATKKTVKAMAEKLNYQPNNIAASLRKGKSNIVGVIVPTSDRHFFASVIRGIDEAINGEGYNLLICQSNDLTSKEKTNIDALLNIKVDGVIASLAKETTDFLHYRRILERGVPLILYDRINENLEVNTVNSDDYLGAYKATTHLIDQGCQRIAHFAGQQHLNIYKERLRGYIDALKKNNIIIDEQWILESDLINTPEQVGLTGRQLTQQLLEMDEVPEAIFSSSDFAAMGAIQQLKKCKISIPDEMAVVGYSNEVSASFIDPSLSSVDEQSKKMGYFAAQLFLEQVNTTEVSFTPRKTVLKPELIIRKSSKLEP